MAPSRTHTSTVIPNKPGVVVSGSDPDAAQHIVQPGTGYDAVVNITDLQYTGSGTLLSTGRHILTAAHVVDTMDTDSIRVNFDLPTGRVTYMVKTKYIHPDWAGGNTWGNDLAILELVEVAPVDGMEIYRGSNEVGAQFTLVGYGAKGTGAAGAADVDYDIGDIKRIGINRYEALNTELEDALNTSFGTTPEGAMLFYDFDDGTTAHDAFGQLLGKHDTGLGAMEVNSAGGDSGGPNFINENGTSYIAGIVAGGNALGEFAGSDILSGINSSFGEISHDTRISYYADWIDSITGQSPTEPGGPTIELAQFMEFNSATMTDMALVQQINGNLLAASSIELKLMNQDSVAGGGSAVTELGIGGVSFNRGGQQVTLESTAIQNATSYEAMASALNDALLAAGIFDMKALLGDSFSTTHPTSGQTLNGTTLLLQDYSASALSSAVFTDGATTTAANIFLQAATTAPATTGVTVSDVNLLGADSQVSLFSSLQLSDSLVMGSGVLLTSGDGTPETENTATDMSTSVDDTVAGGDGDNELTAIVQSAFEDAGESSDASVLEMTLNVSNPDVTSISLDVIFGSDEYPEFADSNYVDIAAVTADGTNYGLFSNGKPLSILQDNINHGGIFTNDGLAIEYDGLTHRLTIVVPVSQGANAIRIGVADTGDEYYDSGLFISNLRTNLNTGDSGGVLLEIAGDDAGGTLQSANPDEEIAEMFKAKDGNDIIMAGAGNDIAIATGGNNEFHMGTGDDVATGADGNDLFEGGEGADTLIGGGGADTFKGTISDLNGDTIKDMNTESNILVTGTTLTDDQISLQQVTTNSSSLMTTYATQQALVIDQNGDGTADSTIYLEGDFSGGDFKVNNSGADSQIVFAAAPQATFPDTPSNKLFISGADQSVTAGFSAAVFGGANTETLRIGTDEFVTFAPSTGDRVEFAGNFADYTFTLQGNQLGVLDGNNNGAVLSLDGSINTLAFADGSTTVNITGLSTGTLGNQALSSSTQSFTSADLAGSFNSNDNSLEALPGTPAGASNKLFVLGGSQQATVDFDADVFLTAGDTAETISIAAGAEVIVNAVSASDRIEFAGNLSDYTFDLNGNILVVTDSQQTELTMALPGAAGTLAFADGSAALELTGLNSATLGGAQLGADPIQLTVQDISGGFNVTDVSLFGN